MIAKWELSGCGVNTKMAIIFFGRTDLFHTLLTQSYSIAVTLRLSISMRAAGYGEDKGRELHQRSATADSQPAPLLDYGNARELANSVVGRSQPDSSQNPDMTRFLARGIPLNNIADLVHPRRVRPACCSRLCRVQLKIIDMTANSECPAYCGSAGEIHEQS
ncbi:hypothetical protein BD410DRAFT_830615 [Rickenella mellea]|uniref:Uncharacterized protein n=1 Tax=Rickenella mellea TaxID=50990 RepID=A0A4Y7PUS6_9AGAM|nr:hypothetical protein BD410DRAFT_830615 [Rickenella mellea]